LIAVLGAGSWGTALAWLLADGGQTVRLWCRDADQAARIAADRVNARYLPDLPLPAALNATADLHGALEGARTVIAAAPSSATRELLTAVRPHLEPGTAVVLAAKGLERGSGLRLSQVAAEVLGDARRGRIAVLSGPNLSGEVVRKMPTATVIAAEDPALARELQALSGRPFFRVYTNSDVAGVELGGALKNPIAIAGGISDGLGLGNNTKASLLTRGLAEITRLGIAAGGRPATFSGLSGLGDLMATAYSPLSRNYRLGLALGRGDSLEHALGELHQVAEGAPTTLAACDLAERLGIEVPILSELRGILNEGKPVRAAVESLLSRRYRDEELSG
jgi:glycerol-3-phosphate dehydrogenase (NAD(P)+)